MRFFKLARYSRGQTMIEMVVATGMVSLVLVAIVSGIALSVRNSRYSKNKAIATRYAQETLERFRIYRDEVGWNPFLGSVLAGNTTLTYCFPDLPASIAAISTFVGSCTTQKITNSLGPTEFTRQAVVTNTSNTVQVDVSVNWTEGSKIHTVLLTSRFNQWSLQ